MIYSERAEQKGYSNISRLFKAVAYSELINAGNHYKNIQHKGEATTVSGPFLGAEP